MSERQTGDAEDATLEDSEDGTTSRDDDGNGQSTDADSVPSRSRAQRPRRPVSFQQQPFRKRCSSVTQFNNMRRGRGFAV
jgi:hypothetical protein